MKNKKLLTRLFALLASLVLVLALALPCFAEETEQSPTDYIYKRVYSYDELTFYSNAKMIHLPCVIREVVENGDYSFGQIFYSYSSNSITIRYKTFDSDRIYNGVLTFSDNGAPQLEYRVYVDGSLDETLSYELTWEDLELYLIVPVSSASSDPTTPSSDMYSNLFNILKDAVYGSDADLTGSQEYALTLISTILTYATILLPVILVIFIAVWCFKRF